MQRVESDAALEGAGGEQGGQARRPLQVGVPVRGVLHLGVLAARRVPEERAVVLAAGQEEARVDRAPREGPDAALVALEVLGRRVSVPQVPHLQNRMPVVL